MLHFSADVIEASLIFTGRNCGQIWRTPQLLDNIKQQTAFLPEKASFIQRFFHIKHNSITIPTCNRCSNNTKWSKDTNEYGRFCSTKCASKAPEIQIKRKNTLIERYGGPCGLYSPTGREKARQAVQARTPEQRENITAKRWITCEAEYGTNFLQQFAQTKKSNMENKYGYSNPLMVPEFKNRQTNTMLHRYGSATFGDSHISLDTKQKLHDVTWLTTEHHIKKKTLTQIAKELNVDPTTVSNYCKAHSIEIKQLFKSSYETWLYNLLTESKFQVECNKRTIIKGELDLWIPDLRVAIELCGMYWHSEKRVSNSYHQDKLIKCTQQNIQLITIFEDEIVHQPEMVIERVLNILNKNITLVPGIIDLRWESGEMYERAGFVCDKIYPPDYYYTSGHKNRLSKREFTHTKMQKRSKFTYNPDLSEHQNCLANGWYRIYDCGKKRYILTP